MRISTPRALALALPAALAAAAVPAQSLPDAYEPPPRVFLGAIVPAGLIRSGHHQLLDDVAVEGNSARFSIDSVYGSLAARSLPMVAERVRELGTLAQAINHFESADQRLADDLRGRLRVGGESFVEILARPFDTTAKLVDQATTNVGQTFQELNEFGGGQRARDPARSRPDSVYAYSRMIPDDPVLAQHKRSVASQLDLDVYSTNSRVQEFLNTAARARGAGRTSAGTLAVSLGAPALRRVGGGRVQARVRTVMTHKTISELDAQNLASLVDAGLEERTVVDFLRHPPLSPRHKTEITEYALYLDGVAGREALLEAAMHARDEPEALGYAHAARSLSLYHENDEPLAELLAAGHVPVAVTTGGRMLVVLPFDVIFWERRTDEIFSALARLAADRGYAGQEILLAGIATERARANLQRMGYRVRERYAFAAR